MGKKSNQSFVKLFGLVAVLTLSACSSNESTGWTKKASPWDHIRSSESVAEAEESAAFIEPETAQERNVTEDSIAVEMESSPEVFSDNGVEEPIVAPLIGGGILEFPATHYTVQLIASTDIDRVYKFADQNQLSIKYIVPTTRDGLIWHVLLLDIYPDRESAVLGKNEVEATLRTQPWIRSVGSIQKLMY